MVGKTGLVLQHRVEKFQSSLPDNGSSGVSTLTASMEKAVANGSVDDSAKQVLQLVKDNDFTELLESCRSRLSEMVTENEIGTLTVKALAASGIHINVESMPSSLAASMDASRKAALNSLNELLLELDVDPSQLERLQAQVSSTFAQTFDSLSSAAKSDESLSSLFQALDAKTSEWQDATGRLLQTRAVCLFVEGASRLQQRAASIFGNDRFQWAGEIGNKLTKSFTEGDVALARLKSIELADVLKDNLVHAIEVRSESIGGLDGIIAGALSQLKDGGTRSTGQIQELMSSLQNEASTATVNAHETLLAVLSSRSEHRDVALLRIESALCALSNQFGDSVSPEDIARIARGEGGTAKLFEPIARQAKEQIDKHLDLAESGITDARVLGVLGKVRMLMSGELTLASIMDDLVNVLNDDNFLEASETVVQHR
jgi:hypothetical protein